MKKKQIEKKLTSAFKEITPADGFERIKEKLSPNLGERKDIVKNRISLRKSIGIAIAACVVLVAGVFGFSYYGENLSVATVIDIDVNPAIEIKANSNDKVLSAGALNKEAESVLADMELNGQKLDLAVNAVIGSMYKQGYLSDAKEGSILITVQNKDAQKAEKIRRRVVNDVDEALKAEGAEIALINQAVASFGDAEALAKKHNISYGKALFILNLEKKDSSLSSDQLAKLSIKEIADLINEKKIDIKDIVDYDADDSIWENIADEIEDSNEDKLENDNDKPAQNENQDQKVIGEAAAKEKALAHAKVSAKDAVFEKVELSKDDGRYEYEVDFRVGNVEYDYEIDAVSGNVLYFEKDIDDDYRAPANSGSSSNPSSSKPNSSQSVSSAYISASKAKNIALEHAGVSAANASFIKAEFDRDDGKAVYEIEFFSKGYDYEYEIDAKSGKVLDFDKEYDD